MRGGRCQKIENEEYEESIKDVEECVAGKAKNVKQEFINLFYLVYVVDRTPLKDQFDIKVSTRFRNMYEE